MMCFVYIHSHVYISCLVCYRHDDVVEENMARFYLAEMAVAINALHTMGYLHRYCHVSGTPCFCEHRIHLI